MLNKNPYELAIQAMEAAELAEMLARRLNKGAIVYHPYGESFDVSPDLLSRGVATVRGTLNLSHQDIVTNVSADVVYTVRANWMNRSPHLRCKERWFLRLPHADADWHINSDGTICYVLQREWSEYLHLVMAAQNREAAKSAAIEYCLNSSRWLLYCYVDAYRRNLTQWDSKWKAWRHNREGEREYLKQYRKAA